MVKQEFNKLLRTRSIIIFIIAVIIINGFVFLVEEKNTISKIHSKPGDYRKIWTDISESQNFDISSLYEKLDYLNGINEFDNYETIKYPMYTSALHFEIWLYEEVISEVENCVFFQDNIQTIIANTNRLIKKNKDYPEKTRELSAVLEKYKKIAQTETIIGPSRAITAITNNMVTDYFAIAIIIIISITLLPFEFDKEWIDFFKSMRNGNYRLGIAKIKVIALLCIGLGILQIENIIISLSLYGVGNIDRSIQSINGFQNCTLNISVLGYLFLFVVVKVLAYILIGAITFGIFCICKRAVISIVLLITVLTISIVINVSVSNLSPIGGIKIFLPFSFFDVYSFIDGVNFITMGQAVIDKNILVMLVWCFYICLFCGVGIAFFGKESSPLGKWKLNFPNKLISVLRMNNSLFVFENLKVYLYNKTIVILLFGMVMTYFLYSYPVIDNNLEKTYYRKMTEQYAGAVKVNTIDDIHIMIDQYNKQLSEAYINGDNSKIYSMSAALKASNELLEHAEYLKSIDNGGIYDTTAYDVLVDSDLNNSKFIALYVAITSCLVFSVIFVKDYEYNEVGLLKSTVYGKRRKNAYQIVISLIIASFIFIFSWLPMILYQEKVCDISGMSYSAASLEKLSMIPSNITMEVFIDIMYLLRYLGIVFVALLCFLLAKKLRTISFTIVISLAIVALPLCFSIIGIKWFNYVLITPFLIGGL